MLKLIYHSQAATPSVRNSNFGSADSWMYMYLGPEISVHLLVSIICVGLSAYILNFTSTTESTVMARARKQSLNELETHHLKNRECMRKARQRQRREILELKSTAKQLEKQYTELSQHASVKIQDANLSNENDYTKAVAVAKRLGAENLLLQTLLKQKAAWKQKLQCILDFDTSSLASAPHVPGTFDVQIDTLDETQAAEELGFEPLTEWDLTQTILNNKHDIRHVETRILQPSAFDALNDKRTHRMQAFGWEIVQRVAGSTMEFMFTKKFYNLDVLDIMKKTRTNNMQLHEFKKIKAETQRLQVIQQVNPNAYVFVRDVTSPSDISTFRSVFARFLVETTTQLHEFGLDTIGDRLTGVGYTSGTQSVNTNYRRLPSGEESSGQLAWADLSLSIEALDVVNPSTGEKYQRIRWAGRTDYCSEEHAQRDAADTLQSMLRWEMLLVAPALNLVSLCHD